MSSSSQFLLFLGIVLILHSAYSCLHYRELLRDLEESGLGEEEQEQHALPPVDVWVEVLTGALVVLFSELVRSGSSLQPVTAKGGGQKLKPMVAPAYRTRDFDIYTSRARAFY
mmetsp:Transcript_6780/g.14154  ORF Transcript_6780/g.14154 Transcript_6780/m.14154 type:complete len:113 (-) Transcript_6780:92-430(-)|eukprot:CAMPEP_0172442104 /NCGR_PEP_ID=MMETSP1065-20121228/2587_1 /TAXON_ID=265537 /ORGANISM="Amphiprora paludosa, Strain CCMP125" /LENGTH=112 /DNA_ID=CAMNT_0013191817 /DNA_START=156 /DNA_END=494 /DNA_ORIENTATION=+